VGAEGLRFPAKRPPDEGMILMEDICFMVESDLAGSAVLFWSDSVRRH